MPYIPAVIQIDDEKGNRIDLPNNGVQQPIVLVLDTQSLDLSSRDRKDGTTEVKVSVKATSADPNSFLRFFGIITFTLSGGIAHVTVPNLPTDAVLISLTRTSRTPDTDAAGDVYWYRSGDEHDGPIWTFLSTEDSDGSSYVGMWCSPSGSGTPTFSEHLAVTRDGSKVTLRDTSKVTLR